MTDKSKAKRYELFEQAMKNYEEALQASLKLQQESARWWMDLLTQTGSLQEWQAKLNELSSNSVATAQKSMEENLKLIEQNSKTSLQLLKKAMDTANADTVPTAQVKLEELWEASLDALRSNAKAVSQANAKWVESCMHFVPKSKPTTGMRAAA